MAAGLSKKRQYYITYRRLQRIRQELAQAGIESRYADGALTGVNFSIYYRRLNASNGECALLATLVFNGSTYDGWTFKRGLDALKDQCRVDFEVSGGGTVYLLRPLTDAAREWVAEHIPEDAQYLGDAVAVEHRYIADIVSGIRNDGLTVQ